MCSYRYQIAAYIVYPLIVVTVVREFTPDNEVIRNIISTLMRTVCHVPRSTQWSIINVRHFQLNSY